MPLLLGAGMIGVFALILLAGLMVSQAGDKPAPTAPVVQVSPQTSEAARLTTVQPCYPFQLDCAPG